MPCWIHENSSVSWSCCKINSAFTLNMPWPYWLQWPCQFSVYSVRQSLCLASPWTWIGISGWLVLPPIKQSCHRTETKIGKKSCSSMHHTLFTTKDHFVRCIAWWWYFVEDDWVCPNSFCLELHSVNPIAVDDDCKFNELCTSDAWENQEVIKSDLGRKNNDQFFPVG